VVWPGRACFPWELITRRRNLRCTYCYSSAGEALENELSLDELCAVVEHARDLGARRIILLGGGEPLLFPRAEIIRHIDGARPLQAIFTNGICLDTALCDSCSRTG